MMATTLTITTGALTATETAQDDAKAQEVLRCFALATGAREGATNKQLPDHAVRTLRNYMVAVAQDRFRAERRAALDAEAAGAVDFA
jgi:hypothetical protein